MTVKTYPLGPLSSNMYIICTSSGCYVIDPSVAPEKIPCDERPEELTAILATHGHFDHIDAVDKWHERYNDIRVYASRYDFICFEDPEYNASSDFALERKYRTVPEDINSLNISGINVIETPGHYKGSVCILFEEGDERCLFSGDTLFSGSIGRTDLKGGSWKDMESSLRKLRYLNPDTSVYPGHGPSTTIGHELLFNSFL